MKKSTITTRRRRIQFSVRAQPGSKVFVAGDFNDWDQTGKELKDKNNSGEFRGCMNLDPGVYQYKLLINGEWCVDPGCKDWVRNSLGSLNSLLHVE